MSLLKIAGVFMFLAGVILLIGESPVIIGAVLGEYPLSNLSVIGIIFLFAGAVLYNYSQEEYNARDAYLKSAVGGRYEELSERDKVALNKAYRRHSVQDSKRQAEGKMGGLIDVVRTETFEKAINGHPIKRIDAAIEKLREGKGKRERLSHISGNSIRTSKGGRIIYEERNGTIFLMNYTPDHKYGRQH